MIKCFSPSFLDIDLDRTASKCNHHLINHPSLSLESLAQVLPQLPQNSVMYSKGLSDLNINFDRAHIDHKNGLSLEETIETMQTSNSYIAVRRPEQHPLFKGLFSDLIQDTSTLIKHKGKETKAKVPVLWLFIASPNAQTPYHFDRFSNFIMQFRGSKQIAVYPPLDTNVISAAQYEAWMNYSENRPAWEPEKDHLASKFDFAPGEALHIPFTSAHYVKNGPEDVSISLSMFFHSDETQMQANAMRFNHILRKRGMSPSFVRESHKLDISKAMVMPIYDKALKVKRLLRK